MPWTCPQCSFHIAGRAPLPVRCICGFVDGAKPRPPAADIVAMQRAHWLDLHQFSSIATDNQWRSVSEWFAKWQAIIPNVDCSCRKHWAKLVANFPPDFSSRQAFFRWTVDAHNLVNQMLGKPELTYEQAIIANDIDEPVQQPPITAFVAVTSLSPLPRHQETQPRCLDSWKRLGLTIRAVNTPAEIETLRELYPQVDEWVVSDDQGTEYNFPTQRINALVDQSQPFLLINSDIEIRGRQERLLEILASGKVGVGIRYNYSGHWRTGKREGWGIDAFLMRPEQARTLPQTQFCIGRPMWDYWLPYHFDAIGQPMEWVGEPFFYHQSHPVHWETTDLDRGRKWIEEAYGTKEDWQKIRSRWPFGTPER